MQKVSIKKLWELRAAEIQKAMNCPANEAKSLKSNNYEWSEIERYLIANYKLDTFSVYGIKNQLYEKPLTLEDYEFKYRQGDNTELLKLILNSAPKESVNPKLNKQVRF